ncbi:DNA/RNA non-specific endonuclease [Rossellomorea marisflavi]|uniref:DNA/RNA non-specific endonuclease n=1 Tax=Rossellomorea marisflavi TaxID=189381 RepID=UPI0027A2C454|nr:DNA/RNA non-specific endonuclease [Rossellomorea marisflavi]UTE72159.1 DNA/RNA non-specific endonuclease [Rossellomorea marisflavi]
MKRTACLLISLVMMTLAACAPQQDQSSAKEDAKQVSEQKADESKKDSSKSEAPEAKESKKSEESKDEPEKRESEPATTASATSINGDIDYSDYKLIEVDGGDRSGDREPNVRVDIGFGDREYWAFTNEYGQLIRVEAKEIILQDDKTEPVKSSGRYYYDEANVPGTERSYLDQGHVIADSLGGVSNAYNITPQDSTLNRHGDQAYMEKVIRDAGGVTNFVAKISYPDTETQIPDHYTYTYIMKGRTVTDDFDNVNPDDVNARAEAEAEPAAAPEAPATQEGTHDISKIDTDHNGRVTIAEAKAAGFKMPITRDSWLYEYMDDRDGDGMVGE